MSTWSLCCKGMKLGGACAITDTLQHNQRHAGDQDVSLSSIYCLFLHSVYSGISACQYFSVAHVLMSKCQHGCCMRLEDMLNLWKEIRDTGLFSSCVTWHLLSITTCDCGAAFMRQTLPFCSTSQHQLFFPQTREWRRTNNGTLFVTNFRHKIKRIR